MLHCIWCSTQYACMHIHAYIRICIRMYVLYIWYVSYLHVSRTFIIIHMHHMCDVTTLCIYFGIHHAFPYVCKYFYICVSEFTMPFTCHMTMKYITMYPAMVGSVQCDVTTKGCLLCVCVCVCLLLNWSQ